MRFEVISYRGHEIHTHPNLGSVLILPGEVANRQLVLELREKRTGHRDVQAAKDYVDMVLGPEEKPKEEGK